LLFLGRAQAGVVELAHLGFTESAAVRPLALGERVDVPLAVAA
jgi:hypothetical protein